jgi:hypothetical protein
MGAQMGDSKKGPVVNLSRADRLLQALEQQQIDEADLNQLEARAGVFVDMDPTVFG